MRSIGETIYNAAASAFDIPRDRLDTRAPWAAVFADSMKVVDLVMPVEAASEIDLDDDEMFSVKCLDDLVRVVEKHLGDDGAAGGRVPL